MATDGRNIGSELFRSLATGLASYAGAREAEKTKREQNAIQAFQAMTQMQEANRAAQEHALKMAGLQLENRARDLTLKDLLDKSRDPEGYAKKQAIIAANAQAAADEVAQRSQLQQMFGVNNGLDLLSGINSGTISLPTDSKFQLGGLTLTGAQSADPLESLKRQKLQAEIGATNALAGQRVSNTSDNTDLVGRTNSAVRVWQSQLEDSQKAVKDAQDQYDLGTMMDLPESEMKKREQILSDAKARRDNLSQSPAEQLGLIIGQLFGGGPQQQATANTAGGMDIDAMIAALEAALASDTTTR